MTKERAGDYAKKLALNMGITFYVVRSREGRFFAVQAPSDDCEILAIELQSLIDLDFEVEFTGFDTPEIDILLDQEPNRILSLGFVKRHDDFPEAVNALGHAGDESLGHDGRGLLTLRKVHDLADIARTHPARAAHDMDRILVTARGNQADACPFSLDEGIRTDGGAMRKHGDITAEAFKGQAQAPRRQAHCGEHPLGEVLGSGHRFGRGYPATAV